MTYDLALLSLPKISGAVSEHRSQDRQSCGVVTVIDFMRGLQSSHRHTQAADMSSILAIVVAKAVPIDSNPDFRSKLGWLNSVGAFMGPAYVNVHNEQIK